MTSFQEEKLLQNRLSYFDFINPLFGNIFVTSFNSFFPCLSFISTLRIFFILFQKFLKWEKYRKEKRRKSKSLGFVVTKCITIKKFVGLRSLKKNYCFGWIILEKSSSFGRFWKNIYGLESFSSLEEKILTQGVLKKQKIAFRTF